MALERRLTKLELARGPETDPQADAAFARMVEALDRLAARKAAGDVTADAELKAIAAMGHHDGA